MSAVAARAPGSLTVVVFEGQSLNLRSSMLFGVDPWPYRLMAGRGLPWATVALDNASWTDLLTGTDAAAGQPSSTRLHPIAQVSSAAKKILVLCGGQTDLNGEGDSGTQVFADLVANAQAARTAGFTHVIATTIPGSSTYDSGEEIARNDHNTLLLADAGGDFDGVVDLTVTSLDTHNDTDFWDVIHLSAIGADKLADAADPVLDTVLAA
ncbi:MAG: hypothetical protein U5L95_05360 [Candidatus Saccharibacteria bacterium]|nr:hypothetical protein [Candidatus Saccharibacteria bacterium]